MKGKIALVLAFVLLFAVSMPVGGYAAGMDTELENAIKIVKSKFSIPDNYKFSSNISTDGARKIYYLTWYNDVADDAVKIGATVDEDGNILSYSRYTSYDYRQTKKLPRLSRQDAREKAEAYINIIAPGLLEELKYVESYQGGIGDYSYNFSYYRVVNGVPFFNDRVNVNVNRDTGELLDYYRNWTFNLDFPPVKDPITQKEAEEAYMKNIGLKLIYKYKFEKENVQKAYPVYVPVYSSSNYAIDAFTGERRRLRDNYYVIRGAEGYGMNFLKSMKADTAQEIQLSPEEIKAVQEAAKLISQDETEKIARETKFLDITGAYKLQSCNLNTNWPDKSQYVWSLYFRKQSDEKAAGSEYVSLTIDAKSKVITSFYRGGPSTDSAKPKNSMSKAKTEAEAFLKKYYSNYYSQTEYDSVASEGSVYYSNEMPNSRFSFIYNRLVNGVPFPDNGIVINYDNLTGTIDGFSLTWYNMAFPAVDKVIGIEAASESLFKNVGLGLEYKLLEVKSDYVSDIKDYSNDAKIMPVTENKKAVLVYSLNSEKPNIIDANSGNLLNYSGEEYKEETRIDYTDIKGHPAEKQIMALADNGVYLEGEKFRPDEAITQLDFMKLLSRTLNYYKPITPLSTEKDIDDMYAYLMREGIIKAGEKAPKSAVKREEAVKYLIRALKFEKVAELKGIFNIGFKDKDNISPELTGYVAIASGLGIVDGKSAYFKPGEKITRGESAIMIYNYLQS